MTDSITVTGVVGSDPRLHVTTQGLAIASFRLASTRRYFDRAKGTWEDGETNWYTVSGFRQLASNASGELVGKGDMRAQLRQVCENLKSALKADGASGSVTWSIDGQRVASASFDTTVRIWDANSGAELGVLGGHTDQALSVDWSSTGRIAAGGADRLVLVWEL